MPRSTARKAKGVPGKLDALFIELRRVLPAGLSEFEAKAIHDARVASRRLSAAVEVLRPVLPEKQRKPVARALRKLRRELGPYRDLDVLRKHAVELAETRGLRPGADWLAARLLAEQVDLRGDGGGPKAIEKRTARLAAWDALAPYVHDSADAVPGLLAAGVRTQFDEFEHEVSRLADPAVTTVDPHLVRIAAKSLRYTLEMAAEDTHTAALPRSVFKTFKAMQDRLGLWHDYIVLAEKAADALARSGVAHHQPAAAASLADLAAEAIRRAAGELDGFRKLWREHGAALAMTVRETFPLSTELPDHPDVPPATPPIATEAMREPSSAAGAGGLSATQTA